MRVRLTELFVRKAQPEPERSPIFMDAEVIGVGVQVRPNGRKIFTVDDTVDARRRCITIGDWPDWSVAAARDEVNHLKRKTDVGKYISPRADRCLERSQRIAIGTVIRAKASCQHQRAAVDNSLLPFS